METTTNLKLNYLLGGEINIHRIGYGGMQLTGHGVWGEARDRENAKKILTKAAEAGVNFFDTADAYGPYTNEILFHDALHIYYDKIIIATKGGFERPGPGKWKPNGNPEHIKESIEGSLKRLQKDQIDLWQLHRIDPEVPVEETLEPVVDAVNDGKIKFVGLSEVGIEDIERARKVINIVSVQNHYNLNYKEWDEVVDYTAKENMAFIPWFPLASGPNKMENKISSIAKKYNASNAQIALAWLLRRSDNILLIPGTTSADHLHDNLNAANIEFSDDDFAELSK
jgi:pyridoxine 4-dehydrogenase